MLVTAFGTTPDFCNLLAVRHTTGGNVLVRDVACYTAFGALQSQSSLISYTSAD